MPQAKQIPITEWSEESFTPSLPVRLPKARLTKTAAKFDDNLTYENWLEIGMEFAAMTDSCQWWIGDWLLHGQAKFGDEKYARAAALSGYAEKSLAQYAWVSESVPNSIRIENLSWSHHHFIASLEPDEQKRLLDLASKNNWSVSELRMQIKGPDSPSKPFQISKWFGTAFDKIKSLSLTPERKAELKQALKPLVEFYETL